MFSDDEAYEVLTKEIRRLRGLMWNISNQFWSSEVEGSKQQELKELNKKYWSELTFIESNHSFVARDFDIYVSTIDIALKKFMDEHPEPPIQEICTHGEKTLRKRQYADDSLHVVEQCLTCGIMVKSVKITANLNFKNMEFFDQSIQDKWQSVNERHSHWLSKKHKVFQDAKYAGGDAPPEFDHDAFQKTYYLKHPRPVTPETCLHSEVEPRYRKYDSSDGIVKQCLQCGKHLSAVKKSDFPNYFDLPKFDEELSKNLREKVGDWAKARTEAYQIARDKFREESWVKYVTGELQINDNSTFATYYNSPEWSNTRLRIFKRDKRACRNINCGKLSECVHHITYDRLGAENDYDLISLCNSCHEKVHAIQGAIPYPYKLTPKEIENLDATKEDLCLKIEY